MFVIMRKRRDLNDWHSKGYAGLLVYVCHCDVPFDVRQRQRCHGELYFAIMPAVSENLFIDPALNYFTWVPCHLAAGGEVQSTSHGNHQY